MVNSMGSLFSSERKNLQTELAECRESLRLSKKKNTRLQGINTQRTIHEINKTGGTRKYRRRN